jgi:hypothetical protein
MVFLLLSDRPFLQCYATRTGDGADTKGEVLSDHPGGESDTSSSKEEGDHDGAAYATFPPL